jgi:hypothetical protein
LFEIVGRDRFPESSRSPGLKSSALSQSTFSHQHKSGHISITLVANP